MSDEDLKPLGDLAREREAERVRWEASDAARALIAPLGAAERRRFLRGVLPAEEPERPRVLAWSGALAAVAACAAALTLVFTPAAALPTYTLEIPTLGYSAVRGESAPAETWTLARGMAFDVVLRPAAAASGPVEARAFLEVASGRTGLDWPAEVSAEGAARFTGRVGERPVLPLGASRLVFAVGRPEDVRRWVKGGGDERALAVFHLDVVVQE